MNLMVKKLVVPIALALLVGCGGQIPITIPQPPTPTAVPPTSTPTPSPTSTPTPVGGKVVITATSTELRVGEVVTVTVTLDNTGPVMVGLPQFSLLCEHEDDSPVLEPARAEPVVHSLGVQPGETDAATFVFQAVRPGKVTVQASVNFEFQVGPEVGYQGTPFWQWSTVSSEEALEIRVAGLSTELGFSDELIAQLEAEGYRLKEGYEVTWQDSTYGAYMTVTQRMPFAGPYLLIYRLDALTPRRLLEVTNMYGGFLGADEGPNGWQDVNGDGRPELAVIFSTGGNCWACEQLHLFQITPEGEIVDLTERVAAGQGRPDGFAFRQLMDMEGDGIWELITLDTRWEFYDFLCHVCSPGVRHIYAWADDIYQDASPHYPALYEEAIAQLKGSLEASFGGSLGDYQVGNAISLLLNYEAAGRRDEGWSLYWSLSDPDNWAQVDPQIREAVNRIRDHLREQYEAEEPFAP